MRRPDISDSMTTHRAQGWLLPAGILLIGALLMTLVILQLPPAAQSEADIDTAPRVVGTSTPMATATDLALPQEFEDAPVLDPGWQVVPQEAGGIFLGLRDASDRVIFSAVSESGSVLWEAERPRICSAFVATLSADRPIGVLMDLQAGTDTLTTSTATAYDLRTGEEIWGPVEVPGPHQGPGLVFSAPPDDFMGNSGPRVALDPGSGSILADERELDGAHIVGEHGGTVLLAKQNELIAMSADDASLWTLTLDEFGWNPKEAVEGRQISDGVVILSETESGRTAVVRLDDGSVLTLDARETDFDPATGTLIVLGELLTGYDASGDVSWQQAPPADSTLVSAGRGVVYLRSPNGTRVYDVVTGAHYATTVVDVPTMITGRGAGIIGPTEHPLLVAAEH